MRRHRVLASAAPLVVAVLLAGCGDRGEEPPGGLSRSEVRQIVRSELANTPPADSGVSRGEVEEVVRAAFESAPRPVLTEADIAAVVQAAVADMVPAESGVTSAQVEAIVRYAVASIPSKSDPARYTQFFVDNAVSRYRSEGLEATVAHYSRQESVDGQWYVFVVDDDDTVIAHYNPNLLGLDLKGPVGTDINGYVFGSEMLSATDDGKWVSYVYTNPATSDLGSGDFGDVQLKNAWVVRHDELLFGSGWYIDADEFTKSVIATMVDKFGELGLEGTISYFAGDDSARAGLAQTVDYYNNAENVAGEWFGFIADAEGTFILHSDPAMLGRHLTDLFGPKPLEATERGNWFTAGDADPSTRTPLSIRAWVVSDHGMTFGAGWYDDGTN